jgi:hypothetical protein
VGEAQGGAPSVAGDPRGLVKQPVARPLELPGAGLVVSSPRREQQLLGEGDEVLGEHHEPQAWLWAKD